VNLFSVKTEVEVLSVGFLFVANTQFGRWRTPVALSLLPAPQHDPPHSLGITIQPAGKARTPTRIPFCMANTRRMQASAEAQCSRVYLHISSPRSYWR